MPRLEAARGGGMSEQLKGEAHSEERQNLFKELDLCEAGIARYDGFLFQIRSWMITVVSGIATLAITQNTPELFTLAAYSIAAFWLMEGNAKSYQYVFIHRARQVEDTLRRSGKNGIASAIGAFSRYELQLASYGA